MKYEKWIIYSGFIITALFLVFIFRPSGGSLSGIQAVQNSSEIRLKAIGELVLAYEKRHNGARPRKMSDVLNLGDKYYFSMFRVAEENSAILISDQNRYLIDEESDYILSPVEAKTVLVSERPNLWADGSIAVCRRDLKVDRLTVNQFKNVR